MSNSKEVVQKLLTNVRERLQVSLGVTTPSEELTLQAAKELNLVVGKRGRDGGTFPTDAGLEYLGFDVTKFRADETVERELVRANRPKTVRAGAAAPVVETDSVVVVGETESV